MRTALVAFVLPLASLLVAACGHSVTYTPLNHPPRALAPREPASVELFTTSPPRRPYVEVGLFEIEQQSPASEGTPAMFAALRKRAAKIGCDALVVTGTSDRVQSVSTHEHGVVHLNSAPMGGMRTGTYMGMGTGTVNTVRAHRAACIVYSDAPLDLTTPTPTPTPTPTERSL